VSAASVSDLVATLPEIADVGEIRSVDYSNINAALMDTQTAFGLRDKLREVLKDDSVSGVVVTHGTATLEETAYLLDLTLGSDKPVVITGAQRNFDERDPDGPRNVLYAAMIAAHPESRGRGVMVSLGGEIHPERTVMKMNTENLTCFGSRDSGPIGAVTKQGVTFFAMPQRRLLLDVKKIRQDVHIIKMGQGGSRLLFDACINAKVDGIVVEATGGGNVNMPFYDGICSALDAGIPVVAGIRIQSGSPHPGKAYLGAFTTLIAKGAISSGYLSGLKARILLMVALGQTTKLDELRAIFAQAGGT
jgi:L-asparaginase